MLFWLGGMLAAAAPASAEEPKAEALLDAMTAFYRSQEALEVQAEMTIDVAAPGQPEPVQQRIKQTIKLERPDRYALVSEGEGPFFSSPSVYLNEGAVTLKLEDQGWIQAEGIESVGEMFRNPSLGYDENAGGNIIFDQNLALTFLNKLLFKELGQGWREDLAGLRYAGEDEVGPRKAHHLVLTTETRQFGEPAVMDLHVWIQQGEQPFLLRLNPDMSKLFPEEEGTPQPEISMESEWSGWNVSPEFDPADFTAPEPDDEAPVFPSFEALMQAQLASQNPALTLTGTEAPDFTLPLLEGGEFALGKQRGERIVVLGFWATWLTPESDSLTALAKIREAVKDRDVAVLAVSLGEEAGTVKTYMEDRKVGEIAIALDMKQELVAKYKVRSIPQTVVIGRDGEVKQVHIGVDEAFAGELLEQLDVLLGAPAPSAAP